MPRAPVSSCSVAGLGPVTAEFDLDCDRVAANFEVARVAISAIVPFADSSVAFRAIPVYFVDANSFWIDGVELGGNFHPLTGIVLGRCGGFLAHELLHVWDTQHLAVGTSWHEGWETNGYAAASRAALYATNCDQ